MMVVQPNKNQRRQVMRATDSLAGLKIPLLGIVVNRVDAEGDRGYYEYSGGYGYGDAAEYGIDEAARASGDGEVLFAANLSDRAGFNETDRSGETVPKRVA